MTTFQEKRQARVDRFRAKADKKHQEANGRFNSQNIKTVRGLQGEPIKIGHHSEGRHRRLLERADNDMRKGSEAYQSAKEYERRADAAENNRAIFSDDPEALQKLRAKLAELVTAQETMKRINAAYRKFKRNPDSLDSCELSDDEKQMVRTFVPERGLQKAPYASWALSNNNASIRTVRERIKELEATEGAETTERKHEGFTVVENVEANRIQIKFADIPDEDVRRWLKRHGFRWSRYHSAWQRHLNQVGKNHVEMFVVWHSGRLA